MDEENKKKIVTSFVIGSLSLGATYFFKDEIISLLKDLNVRKEKEKKAENRSETEDNFYNFYANMSEKDKLRWRKSVVKGITNITDKMFVYIDSQTLSQTYSSLNSLKYIVNMYSMNAVPFENLYDEYRKTLKEIFNIQ